MSTSPTRRLRRWVVVIALTLLLLVGGAIVFLRVRFHGEALADTVESMLNEKMRGRIRVASIDWPTSSLTEVVAGGWIPFTLSDVDVWDAEGKQLLHVERVTCEVDIHALMFGNHDFVFRNVVLDSGWAILEEIPEPYPLHAYDTTVVSLLASFYGQRKPGWHAGVFAASPPIFDIRDFRLRNVDLQLRFGVATELRDDRFVVTGHAFVADAKDVEGGGFLYTDASDPLVPKVYFSIPETEQPLVARGGAVVTVLDDYVFHLESLELHRLAQLPTRWPDDPVANNLQLVVRGTSVEGADIELEGWLLDYWDSPYGGNYQVHAEITHAGEMARQSIDPWMSGDDLTITADVTGPILYPTIEANLKNLEYNVEIRELRRPLKLYLDDLLVDLDMATESGRLHKAIGRVEQEPRKDGQVEVSANFALSPYHVDANLAITEPIEFGEYLEPPLSTALGTDLYGAFHATGDSDFTLQVDELDLHIGRLHLDGGTIYARDQFATIEFDRFHADAGKTSVTIDGEFETDPETFDLEVDVDSTDLDVWMRRLGMSPIARSAHGRDLRIGGTLDAPAVDGEIALGGVPVIDDLTTSFVYGGTELTIRRGTSRRIGDIRMRGTIDLAGAPRAERLVVTGRAVDLGKLPLGGMASGKVDVDLVANGPLDPSRLRIDAVATSDDVTVLGQRASRLRACLNHDPNDPVCREAAALTPDESKQCIADARRGGQCLLAGAQRTDGGTATIVARTDAADHLAGRVAVDALPIDAVARAAGAQEVPAGGRAEVAIDLGGTLQAPTANGTVSMLRSWILGAYLGDEDLELRVATSDDPRAECARGRPKPPTTATGKLAICGELADGRIVVAAVVRTSGNMPVRAFVDLRRVEVDPFVDVGELLGTPTPLRAWASGTVTVETELRGEKPPLDVRLELPEVALLVPRTDSDGRPAPLVFRTKEGTPLSVAFDGTNLVFGRPVTFETPAGELTVAGKATENVLDLTIAGLLELEDLQPFLATWFDHSEGRITVDGVVKGTFDDPQITASVALDDLLLRPAGQDTEIRIDEARLDHAPDRGLSLTSVTIEVDDRSSGEHAELRAHGGVKLDGIEPTLWAVIVEGELSGKMLLAFAPQQLSQASGVADLYLSLTGDGPRPTIEGDLSFDAKRPFALIPRGLRRELILSGGRIEFDESTLVFDDVSGSIDDVGRITDVAGEIGLVDGSPVEGDITLSADGIPFDSPGTLGLTISADRLGLVWGDDTNGDGQPDMEIYGSVEIVQGRYTKDFRFDEVIRPAETSAAPRRPFWEEYPMLGNASLDLEIDARSLSVVNNIANIELSGEARLAGSPREPRIDGVINVTRGTFKPQGFRARFTRTTGTVAFTRFAKFPDQTPEIDITSEADYRDKNGQDHLIRLTLDGTLSQLNWDLTTSGGLTKAQTLQLITLGTTPDDMQSRNVLDTDPTRIDPSTNPDQSAADQVIKDVAGDFISLLVEDPLKDVDLLDVARVEVSPGAIGFRGEKKLNSNTNVIGDFEQTVKGRTVHVRMEIKSTEGATIQIGVLSKNFDDPAEEDVTDREVKLVYRWTWP